MMISYTLPVNAILLLGPTGAGKSPLGEYLAAHGLAGRTCHHLDFGAELRAVGQESERAGAYTPDERSFVHGVLAGGLLLENEHFALAEKIIRQFLDRAGFHNEHLLVLNGIPRHVGQAEDIARIASIHAVIVLECPGNDVVCRIEGNVGGDREGRVDDARELIDKKLAIFTERTAPLVAYYAGARSTIYRIPVTSMMRTEDTYRLLSSLAAVDPPVPFITEPPQG